MIRIYALIRNQKSRLFILTVDGGYYRITGIHYPGKTGTHYSGISGIGCSGIYREYLSLKEVHKIERLYACGSILPNLREVLRAFLFCCYTGLRLSDMRALRYKDIGDDVITIIMHKTKELVYIPLIPQAKEYLLKGEADDLVFNPVVDQMINRYLKRELPMLGIHKKITFHCARHTFATNCLEKGISKDTIQKVLGHKDIKTTDLYTKYTISHQKKEMSKWKR